VARGTTAHIDAIGLETHEPGHWQAALGANHLPCGCMRCDIRPSQHCESRCTCIPSDLRIARRIHGTTAAETSRRRSARASGGDRNGPLSSHLHLLQRDTSPASKTTPVSRTAVKETWTNARVCSVWGQGG